MAGAALRVDDAAPYFTTKAGVHFNSRCAGEPPYVRLRQLSERKLRRWSACLEKPGPT
jgi:hypothetical protein